MDDFELFKFYSYYLLWLCYVSYVDINKRLHIMKYNLLLLIDTFYQSILSLPIYLVAFISCLDKAHIKHDFSLEIKTK